MFNSILNPLKTVNIEKSVAIAPSKPLEFKSITIISPKRIIEPKDNSGDQLLATTKKLIEDESVDLPKVAAAHEFKSVTVTAPQRILDVETSKNSSIKNSELVSLGGVEFSKDENKLVASNLFHGIGVKSGKFITTKVVTDEVRVSLAAPRNIDVSSSVQNAIASAKKQLSKNAIAFRHKSPEREVLQKLFDDPKVAENSVGLGTSGIVLSASTAYFNQGFESGVKGFEFTPSYASNQENIYVDDFGKINLETSLATNNAVISGMIRSENHLPMHVDLAFNKDEVGLEMNLPLIDVNDYAALLDSMNLDGAGAQLLVELNDNVVDVEIDAPYEKKFFLSEDFKVVTEKDDFKFIMIAGAQYGNALLQFVMSDSRIAERIVNLVDGAVTYEFSMIDEVRLKDFTLSESVEILANQIVEFNSDNEASYNEDGSLHMKLGVHPRFHRNYYEFKHLSNSLFLGEDGKEQIDIPTIADMQNAYDALKIPEGSGQCVVQINLSKQAYEIDMNSSDGHKGLNLEAVYLEKNGHFESEISPITKRIFVTGEGQGVIDLRIKYVDDTYEYLQTYCSTNTYLVEQL